MAVPVELWGETLARPGPTTPTVANAIAAFEPVTHDRQPGADAGRPRGRLRAGVEIVELPLDDSWLRDCGPIYTYGDDGRREAVHFRFNAWGEKFPAWDRDAAVGAADRRAARGRGAQAPLVLEGGSILHRRRGHAADHRAVPAATRTATPRCPRGDRGRAAAPALGAERIVWLGQGLVEDRDTDGHVDLIAAFTGPGHVLLQTVPEGNPTSTHCQENLDRLQRPGSRSPSCRSCPTPRWPGRRWRPAT